MNAPLVSQELQNILINNKKFIEEVSAKVCNTKKSDRRDSMVSMSSATNPDEAKRLVERLDKDSFWKVMGYVTAASILAAFGLGSNSATAIIGAMLLSPIGGTIMKEMLSKKNLIRK